MSEAPSLALEVVLRAPSQRKQQLLIACVSLTVAVVLVVVGGVIARIFLSPESEEAFKLESPITVFGHNETESIVVLLGGHDGVSDLPIAALEFIGQNSSCAALPKKLPFTKTIGSSYLSGVDNQGTLTACISGDGLVCRTYNRYQENPNWDSVSVTNVVGQVMSDTIGFFLDKHFYFPIKSVISSRVAKGQLVRYNPYTFISNTCTLKSKDWPFGACAIPFKETVAVTGGHSGDFRPQSESFMTQLDRDCIEKNFETLPRMQIGRMFHGCNLIQSGTSKLLLIVAGGVARTENVIENSVEIFDLMDPKKRSWQFLPSMQVPRSNYPSTVILHGQLTIIGGRGKSGKGLDSAEMFDLASQTWRNVTQWKLKQPRFDHSTAWISKDLCKIFQKNKSKTFEVP